MGTLGCINDMMRRDKENRGASPGESRTAE